MTDLGSLPELGAGLGYRTQLADLIWDQHGALDWIEIVAEEFIGTSAERLARLGELSSEYTIIPHGVELNIGGSEEPDGDYLDHIAALVRSVGAPWFSDHLCFTAAGGISLGALIPLSRNRRTARLVARRARRVQDRVGVPLILENISYRLDMPDEFTEAEFITEFLEISDCGLLLDVTNLYINATNHGYNAQEFLAQLPSERIVQVHLAGVEWRGDEAVDTHSGPVPDAVWELFRVVADKVAVKAALVERDGNFPRDATELLDDVRTARQILCAAQDERA